VYIVGNLRLHVDLDLGHFVLQTVDYALAILVVLAEDHKLVDVGECQLGLGFEGQSEQLVDHCHLYHLLTHHHKTISINRSNSTNMHTNTQGIDALFGIA
jgi:hypothetical protein